MRRRSSIIAVGSRMTMMTSRWQDRMVPIVVWLHWVTFLAAVVFLLLLMLFFALPTANERAHTLAQAALPRASHAHLSCFGRCDRRWGRCRCQALVHSTASSPGLSSKGSGSHTGEGPQSHSSSSEGLQSKVILCWCKTRGVP